jgi:hypothetical protein
MSTLNTLLVSVPDGSDRGRPREPPRRICACGVSLDKLLPMDKEGSGSDTSHAENACIFRESHALHSNQQGVTQSKKFTLLMVEKLDFV